MLVLRPVRSSDLEQLYKLSGKVTVGLTTFPHDRAILRQRIKKAVRSFSDKPLKPGGEIYVFVLEDTQTRKLVGTSAIFSKVGGYEPSYTYRIETETRQSKTLKVKRTNQYLRLVKDYNGPTEIGTLFLDPAYRKSGNGRLLSLSRFLFMAQYRRCFEPKVIVEIRGVIDKKDHSPFWEALGKYFFDVEFKKADLMVMKDKTFIADLMPEHPIYISLLPKAAQEVIGQVHKDTQPALHLLQREGFKFNQEIDIFEAGPTLVAKLTEIRTVRKSQTAVVQRISPTVERKEEFLLAAVDSFQRFRVGLGHVRTLSPGRVEIPPPYAEALQIKVGSKVRFVAIKP